MKILTSSFWIFGWLICCSGSLQLANAQSPLDSSYLADYRALSSSSELEKPTLWNKLALYFLETNELDSCDYYASLALQSSLKIPDKDNTLLAYWYIGRAALFRNDFPRTIAYMEKAVQLSQQNQDTSRLLNATNTLGLALKNLGRFEEAIGVYLQGLEIARAYGDTYLLTMFPINLGVIYRFLGDDELSLEYYRQGRFWAEKNRDTLHQGIILINIGNFFSSELRLDSAQAYFKMAERLHLESKNYNQLGMIYANLTHVYIRQGQQELAIGYGEKVLEMADTVDFPIQAIIVALINTGEAYLNLQDYQRAGGYLKEAELVGTRNNHITLLEEVYKIQARYFEEIGATDQAYAYLKQHLALKDSLFDKNLISKAVKLESEAALTKKEARIAQLEEHGQKQQVQNKNLKSWLVLALIVLLVSVTILYIYLLRQEAQRLAFRQQAAENKLEALRNQMNPHFLFNSFNAIQHYILKSEKDNAYHYLTQFAHLLRLILDNASSMTIDLQKEIDLLRSYVQLEALRFQDKFTCDFEITPELLERNPTIPSMIIQPYIENAILHGLSNKENGDGQLTVRFSYTNDQQVQCWIEDNGIGRAKAQAIKRTKEKQESHRSIAMNNTSRRLQILENAGYPKGNVVVEDLYDEQQEAAGTRVMVVLNTI